MKMRILNIVATALVAFSAVSASAQSAVSYSMPNAIEKSRFNPAITPDRGYFNIPLVGAVSLGTAGNIAISDFVVAGENGGLSTILDTSVPADVALSGLKDINNTSIANRLGILGFGSYSKKNNSFWSFDISLATSFNTSMPIEMVEFLKTAPENITIKDLNIYTESYAEMAFSYSRQINEKFTVGGRAKALVGLANADLNIDRMDITMNASEWSAEAEGTFDLNASGVTLDSSSNNNSVEEYELGDIKGEPDGIGGFGFAVDLGVVYDFNDRTQFSLAVNDLGAIKWKKDANTNAKLANNFNFSGAKYDANTGEMIDGTGIELGDIVLEEQESRSTTNWLQSSVVMGGDYDFFDHKLSAGALYEIDFWKSKTLHNISVVASYTPINWFTLGASYGITNSAGRSLGLAANIATGFVNLYVASDFLLSKKSVQYIPINQASMNLTFGLAVPLGPKANRDCGE